MENYYQLLGVEETATQEDIKKAYRQKAKELHPDKGGDEESFKKISAAYDILSDENKRAQYDNQRKFNGGSSNFGFPPGFGDGLGADFFSRFFNQGRSNNIIKGENLFLNLNLTLEEIYNGVSKAFKYKRNIKCQPCSGTGALNGNSFKVCGGCAGSGIKTINHPHFQNIMTHCDECNGVGKSIDVNCNTCNGSGINLIEDTVEIKVPKGISPNMEFAIQNKGNFNKGATAAGDLIVSITELHHEHFSRIKNDLHYDLFITISDAILGNKEVIVPVINSNIKIAIEPGTEPGKTLRIGGKGMPILNNNGYGDFYAHVNIYIPKDLSEEDKKAIEKINKKSIFTIPEKNLQKGIFKKITEFNNLFI